MLRITDDHEGWNSNHVDIKHAPVDIQDMEMSLLAPLLYVESSLMWSAQFFSFVLFLI